MKNGTETMGLSEGRCWLVAASGLPSVGDPASARTGFSAPSAPEPLSFKGYHYDEENPICNHAQVTHARIWLERDASSDQSEKGAFLRLKEGKRNEVTLTPEIETITLEIPPGTTVSAPVDILTTFTSDTEDESITVKLLPLEFQMLDPQEVDWKSVQELKVATWEKAWTSTGFNQNFLDDEFIREPNRFRVCVGGELPEGMRTFYLSSSGALAAEHNDNATAIELEPLTLQMPTTFVGTVSKPMILVSDIHDNKFRNENTVNDQTHIVELGSDVELRFGSAAADVAISASVAPKKEVHVEVHLLWQASGPDGEAIQEINDQIAVAKEIYAQSGISLIFGMPPQYKVQYHEVSVPGIDFEQPFELNDSNKNILPLADELLTIYATPNNPDIVCLYMDSQVNIFGRPNGVTGITISVNEDIEPFIVGLPYFSQAASNKFGGTILISTVPSRKATLAHEIGHALALMHIGDEFGEDEYPQNLMKDGGTSYSDSHFDSKRLKAFQIERMVGSRFATPVSE